jgi:hypothetical protein
MIYSQICTPTSLTGSQSPGWVNSAGILETDGVVANTPQDVLHGSFTPFLKLSGFTTANIPDEAIIEGIVARITGRNEIAYNTGFHCVGASAGTGSGGLRLLGVADAVGRGMTAFTKNTFATKVVGGDQDKWGSVLLTSSLIKAPEFGLYAIFRNGNTTPQQMFLENIHLEIFYSLPE